jgi:fatty acid desaturase
MRRRASVDVKSLAALSVEWLLAAAAIGTALFFATWWAYAIAAVVIATRQHAMLMLFHDAVHGLLARRPRVNDALINTLVGIPTLLPIEVYRPLHLRHHRLLGTAADPERTLLFAGQHWSYAPLATAPLVRQLAGDLLLVNGIRTLSALSRAGGLPRVRPTTLVLAALWIAAVAVCLWRWPAATATAFALWLVPLLTLTQLLQKIRSFAEHSGGPRTTPGWDEWTYTWRVGFLGRLTIWPYNINLHLEHHAAPDVPWHALPRLAAATPRFRRGASLAALLYRG